MATRMADDADFISARIKELANENKPKCPRTAEKLLYVCLRESIRCPAECSFYNDWIGPDA